MECYAKKQKTNKQKTDTYSKVGECQKYHVKRKRPDTTENLLVVPVS